MNNLFWNTMQKEVWDEIPYPWKPSFVDIAFYIGTVFILYIRNRPTKKQLHILLIGCTKELRYCLSLFKIRYDLVDFSKHMEEITRPSGDSLCSFIHSSWGDFEPRVNYYDVILGDLVFNLTQKEYASIFLKKMTLSLTQSGSMLFRQRVLGTIKEKNLKDILDDIISLSKKNQYRLHANMQATHEIDKHLYTAFLKKITTNKKSESFIKYFLNSNLNYYIYTEKEIDFLLSQYSTNIIKKSNPRKYVDNFLLIHITKQKS